MPVPYYGDFPEDAMVYIPFNTFSSDDPSASVTITNLADTDIYYHKDGSITDYSADAATLVTIDFDGITGNHMLAIDTSENAYFATGSEYAVRMEGTTVDGATINAWIGSFSIERAGGVLASLKAGTVDVNTKTITAGIIANASFNADVGSTAHGTNIIALAVRKILEELNLDHLLKVDTTVAADGDLEAYCVAGTIMAHLLATGADATLYKASTDSLQGIRDHIGDGTNLTEAGGDGDHLTEAGDDGDHLTAIALPSTGLDAILKNSTFALAIADAIWDEVLTAATHNIATSAGRKIRELTEVMVISQGTAQAGGNTTITLDAGESIVTDFYKGMLVVLLSATGAGQARAIAGYNGGTQVATIGPAWATNPAAATEYAILSFGSTVVAAIDDIDLSATMKTSVNTEADTALTDYGPPTKAEMDTGHGLLATEAKQDIIDTVVDAIKVITDALTAAAATKLALSAGTIVTGTVSHDNTVATTTVFYCDDITEATADHFNGRIVIFTSGALQYQATDITDYALVSGEGKFTVTALTESPADNVTFIII